MKPCTFHVSLVLLIGGLAVAALAIPGVRQGWNPAKLERNDPVWRKALLEVYKSPEELIAQDDRERRRGVSQLKLARGNPEMKEVALTFDDGPHPGYTDRLLDILKREDVPATFFVIGKMVKKDPELAREIVRDGHLLGNHTFSHVTLTKIPVPFIRAEFEACNDIVYKTTGVHMAFCRPPGGDYDADVIKAATDQGLTTVLWTDDPGDFAKPGPEVIEQRTLEKITNGGIILLHDGVEQTMTVLPKIIEYARAKGFRFVTVRQLLADRQAATGLRS